MEITDVPYVGLINTHSKRDGGDDNAHFIFHPLRLYFVTNLQTTKQRLNIFWKERLQSLIVSTKKRNCITVGSLSNFKSHFARQSGVVRQRLDPFGGQFTRHIDAAVSRSTVHDTAAYELKKNDAKLKRLCKKCLINVVNFVQKISEL